MHFHLHHPHQQERSEMVASPRVDVPHSTTPSPGDSSGWLERSYDVSRFDTGGGHVEESTGFESGGDENWVSCILECTARNINDEKSWSYSLYSFPVSSFWDSWAKMIFKWLIHNILLNFRCYRSFSVVAKSLNWFVGLIFSESEILLWIQSP